MPLETFFEILHRIGYFILQLAGAAFLLITAYSLYLNAIAPPLEAYQLELNEN